MKLHLNKTLRLAVLACMACAPAAWADGVPTGLFAKPAPTTTATWTGGAAEGAEVTDAANWGNTNPTGANTYRVFSNGEKLTIGSMGSQTVDSGIVVENNTNVTLTATAWVGDLIVDKGSTLTLTCGPTGGDPNHAYLQEKKSGTVSVYVDGTLNLADPGICFTGWDASHDQNWVIGAEGKITFTGAYYFHRQNNNARDWYIQAVVDTLDGMLNRTKDTTVQRTILDTSAITNKDGVNKQGSAFFPNESGTGQTDKATVTMQDVLDFAVVQVYDKSGNALDSDVVTVTKSAATGITLSYGGYSAADLTWNGGDNGTWGHGLAGFYKTGDDEQVNTSFINGDTVAFSAATAQTVTVAAAGVSANAMSVSGDFTFNGGAISATTLTLSGNVALRGTSALTAGSIDSAGLTGLTLNGGKELTLSDVSALTSITTDAASKVTTSGDIALDNRSLAVSGNLKVGSSDSGSTVALKKGASLTINSGSVVSANYLNIHNADANSTETITIDGGVLNVLSSQKSPNSHDTGFEQPGEQYGVLIGHWKSGSGKIILQNGGVLNATDCSTAVGWDSNGTLAIKGSSQANLYGINSTGRSKTSLVNLEGGRLNLGAQGYKGQENSKIVVVANSTGSTIGTLTNSEITVNETIEMNAGLTVDSAVQEVNATTGIAAAKKNAQNNDISGTITLSGTLTGSGALTKKGVGTLKLTGDSGSYTGNITVEAGTLSVNNNMGKGSLTVKDSAHADLNKASATISALNLGNRLGDAATASVYANTFVSGTTTLSGNNSMIGFANGMTLSLGGDTLRSRATGSSSDIRTTTAGDHTITSTGSAAGITYVNMDLTFKYDSTGTYAFDSALSGTTNITREGSGTVKLSQGAALNSITVTSGKLELAGATNSIAADSSVADGAELLVDNGAKLSIATAKTLSVAGDLSVNGEIALGSGSGAVKANGGTITLGSGGSITGDKVTVSTTKAADTPSGQSLIVDMRGDEGEGETPAATPAGATLSNVTISNSGIQAIDTTGGKTGGITGASVALKGETATMSNVTLADSVVDLTEATTVSLSNVVFGTDTTWKTGDDTAVTSSSTTLQLVATDVAKVNLGESGSDKLTLSLVGSLADGEYSGIFNLDLSDDFMVALYKKTYDGTYNSMDIDFGENVTIAAGTTLTLIPATPYVGVEASIMEGNHGILLNFTPAIPEPATAALSLLALAGLAARRRRK